MTMQWVPKKVPSTPPSKPLPIVVTPIVAVKKMDVDTELGWQVATKIARHSQSLSIIIT